MQQSTKMDTDETLSAAAPPSASENDVDMLDAKNVATAPGTENGAHEGDIPAQMETDAKVRTNRYGMLPIKPFYFVTSFKNFIFQSAASVIMVVFNLLVFSVSSSLICDLTKCLLNLLVAVYILVSSLLL